jgi:Rod binding domain-containing protein
MDAFSALAGLPVAKTATPVVQPSAAELAKREQIEKTSKEFESSFLSVMLSQMFKGTEAEAPFNGGQGEQAFKSFLTDAIAKQVVKSGGIGVADTVAKEMLKLQGLS